MPSTNEHIDFSTVLAGTVHDMKNSLAMLLGSLSEITQQCDPTTCKMHGKFNRIEHEAQRVNRDLILLLTLYKMDQGQYYFNIEETNVHDYLDEIITEYKDLFKGYNIDISLQCEEDLMGYFDQTLLSSIIRTIISNAYQYTTDHITVSAESINGFTKISIIDNGSGYPEKMIFDGLPASSKVNFGTGSTGLGLYFSSRVAELHKSKNRTGYIQINNESKGGCFSIHLP